jgi:hypothetical protein
MANNEMAIKHELVIMTNTRGWHYAKEVAAEILQAKKDKAIEEEDDVKGAALRREAKAAQDFVNIFFAAIENMKQVTDPTEEDSFLEVVM